MNDYERLPSGYLELAIAVVQQAIEDYKIAYMKFLKKGTKTFRLREVTHWFTQGDGQLFTNGKGELLLEFARKEVEKEFNEKQSKRKLLGYNDQIEFNGKTQTMYDWANEIGISAGSLYQRFRNGWSIERALTIPRGNNSGKRKQDI